MQDINNDGSPDWEVKMVFALADFFKFQSANEEDPVNIFDMASAIYDIYRKT